MSTSELRRLVPSWVVSLVRKARRRVREARKVAIQDRAISDYQRRTVRHSYGGYELDVQLADPQGQAWYDRDWAPLEEVRFLQSVGMLRPGARLFDVGAHQGVMALVLASAAGPDGWVLAVEPNAHNCEVARQNIDLNRGRSLGQVEVLHAAVAEKPGTLELTGLTNARVRTDRLHGRIIVDAVTVDELTSRHGPPDVLMVDVEGYECRVLEGAASTLSEHRPCCLIEAHVGCGLESFGGSPAGIVSFFDASVYDVYMAGAEGQSFPKPFTPYRPDSPELSQRCFLAAVPRR